jgi:hypothetical protein
LLDRQTPAQQHRTAAVAAGIGKKWVLCMAAQDLEVIRSVIIVLL